jgi:hypothetical protein
LMALKSTNQDSPGMAALPSGYTHSGSHSYQRFSHRSFRRLIQ